MIFEKSRIPTTHNVVLYNENLERVDCVKYLGIYIYKSGHSLRSQNRLAENASKLWHGLISVFNKYELNINKTYELFDSLVLSVIHFASEIWSYNSGTDVEGIHKKKCVDVF